MNKLDKHRILEKGDEYLTNMDEWKPVPSADWGIQIMFTKYTQVRRPGEAQSRSDTWAHVQANKPISPDSEKPEAAKPSAIVTATAENDKTPALSRSGAGDSPVETKRLSPTEQLIEDATRRVEAEVAKVFAGSLSVPVMASTPGKQRLTESEKALAKAKTSGVARREAPHFKTDIKQVKWGDKKLIWTGRNGTFGCLGIDMANYGAGFVSFVPIGKRGQGNCIIQIPVEAIPQIVEFLNKQERTTK